MGQREQFQNELDDLERLIQSEADQIRRSLARVIDMFRSDSPHVGVEIIANDDPIDALYLEVERDAASVLALQQPVAADLRLVLAVIHINHNLERIGDQCVNIAKLFELSRPEPFPLDLIHDFTSMASQADQMLSVAMLSFAERDVAAARSLVSLDQAVNLAHHRFAQRMDENGGIAALGESGLHGVLISRALERIGDNCVDIGEQVEYLVTGEFVEFTDASLPSG